MRVVRVGFLLLLWSTVTIAGSDFLTEGVDAARTGWVKDEKIFTTANVGSMKLLWKIKLPSTPREMHNLFAPLIAERVNTPQGVREIAVVAGVSDDLFAIDVASGEQLWHKHFDTTFPGGGRVGDALCPGGQTAVPTLGRRRRGKYTIYAVSWDGRLRQVNLADGQDVAPPEKFMPPNGKPYALNLVNGVIYTASAQGCGGVPNAFYSFDLATRKSSTFLPAGGGLWGRRGAAISPEGIAYLGTGDATFNPANQEPRQRDRRRASSTQTSSFNWSTTSGARTRTGCSVAISTSTSRRCPSTTAAASSWWERARNAGCGCSIATTLGGDDHRTTLHTTPLLCNEAQAFDGRGVWGAMARGRTHAGRSGCSCPSGARSTRTFTHRSSTRGRRAAASPPIDSKSRPGNGS